MKLIAIDGAVFEAPDAAGIAEAMARASHSRPASVAHFMAETAMRIRSIDGVSIRSASADLFVADLVLHGYLKDIDGAELPRNGGGES